MSLIVHVVYDGSHQQFRKDLDATHLFKRWMTFAVPAEDGGRCPIEFKMHGRESVIVRPNEALALYFTNDGTIDGRVDYYAAGMDDVASVH